MSRTSLAAPVLRAAARHRPLLSGTVPTIWLQHQLWDGRLSWWEALLSLLIRLHFIVPPTLLFLIWLRNRALYYRLVATMVAVSFVRRRHVHAVAGGSAVDGGARWLDPAPAPDRLPAGHGVAVASSSWIDQLRSCATRLPPCRRCMPRTPCSWCSSASRSDGASGCAPPVRDLHVVRDRVLRRALRLRRPVRLRLRRGGLRRSAACSGSPSRGTLYAPVIAGARGTNS